MHLSLPPPMSNLMYAHRPYPWSDHEARLCFQQTPSNAPSAAPASNPNVQPPQPNALDPQRKGFMEWLRNTGLTVIETTGTAAVRTGEFLVVDIPVFFLDAAKRMWEKAMPSKEQVMAFLERTAAFFREMPLVGTLLERFKYTPEDMESMENMTDPAQWILAFRNPSLFEAADPPSGQDLPPRLMPAQFLLCVDKATREQLFLKFVDNYIPVSEQRKMVERGGGSPVDDATWQTLPPEMRMRLILGGAKGLSSEGSAGRLLSDDEKKNFMRFGDVLGLVYGMDDPSLPDGQRITVNADEEVLLKGWATESVNWRYNPMGLTDEGNNEDITRGISQDYDIALRNRRLSGSEPVATNSQLLQNALGPSLFKGALRLNAFDQTFLQRLYEERQKWDADRSRAVAGKAREMDTMYQASKREKSQEAMNIRDVWDNFSGTEKLVLIAVTAFLLTRKAFRDLAAIGVGAYFVQKFIFKTEDSLDQWSRWIYKGVDAAKGGLSEKVKRFLPGYKPDLENRANVMAQFLNDSDRAHLEMQVMGFSLLGDVPMGVLAQNFKDAGDEWELDVAQGGMVDREMSLAAQQYGWKKGHREFFDGPEGKRNRAESAEAVAYMFYRKAAEDPHNRAAAQKVEQVMRLLPRHTSYSRLGDFAKGRATVDIRVDQGNHPASTQDRMKIIEQQIPEAWEEYQRLVLVGREGCIGNRTTLGIEVERMLGLKKQERVVEGGVRKKGMPETSPPSSAPRVAEGDVARFASESDAARAALEVAIQKHTAEMSAHKPAAEVEAAKHQVDAVRQRLLEADTARRSAEAEVGVHVAEGNVARRSAEADAAKASVAEAAEKHDAAVQAYKPAAEIEAAQKALAEAQRRSAEADGAFQDAEAVLGDRRTEAETARMAAEGATAAHTLAEDVKQRQGEIEVARKQLADAIAAREAAVAARRPDAEVAMLRTQVDNAKRRVAEAEARGKTVEAEWRLRQAEAVAASLKSEMEIRQRAVESSRKALDEAVRVSKPDAEVQTARTALEAAQRKLADTEANLQPAEADLQRMRTEYEALHPPMR